MKNEEKQNDGRSNCNRCARNYTQRLGKGARRVRNRRTSKEHSNYSIVRLNQNTEKGSGDLRRLAIKQDISKNPLASACLKKLQEVINNDNKYKQINVH